MSTAFVIVCSFDRRTIWIVATHDWIIIQKLLSDISRIRSPSVTDRRCRRRLSSPSMSSLLRETYTLSLNFDSTFRTIVLGVSLPGTRRVGPRPIPAARGRSRLAFPPCRRAVSASRVTAADAPACAKASARQGNQRLRGAAGKGEGKGGARRVTGAAGERKAFARPPRRPPDAPCSASPQILQ